jgi:hypothetical protein
MHIYDFITDEHQGHLKTTARNVSNDRFENVLERYRNLFINSFKENSNGGKLKATETSTYLSDYLSDDKNISEYFVQFLELVKNELPTLDKVMEDVIDCYYLFIRGRHHTAVLKMYDILERYDILDTASPANFNVFFRCVEYWPEADRNDEKTFYHLPFNLRNKVKNQRFSVSGMPLWYGGASLLASYFELRKFTLNDENNLGISAWSVNLWSSHRVVDGKYVKNRTKIYDITNEIYNLINYAFSGYKSFADSERQSSFFTTYASFAERQLRIALRKFVLSSLCTFQIGEQSTKSESDPFHEEYVIPQLLTEAIRLHKYDGILFPSTRFLDKDVNFKGKIHLNIFKSNLALFTEYSVNNQHDLELMANFQVQLIDKRKAEAINVVAELKKANEIYNHIMDFLESPICLIQFEDKKKFAEKLDSIKLSLMTYQDVQIKDIPYFDTFIGKVELWAIMNDLERFCVTITNHLYKENFTQWQINIGRI